MLRQTARLLCFTTLFSLLPAYAEPGFERTPVSIFVPNPEKLAPGVALNMRAELASILKTSRIAVAWHDGHGPVAGRLAVMRMIGQCRNDTLLPGDTRLMHEAEALASTHVSNGEVLPFADIRCDELRKFVSSQLADVRKGAERDELLGRALARVMAHELFHILLQTREHGKKGLARPAQTASQLVAPRLNFSEEDERRLSESELPPSGYPVQQGASVPVAPAGVVVTSSNSSGNTGSHGAAVDAAGAVAAVR